MSKREATTSGPTTKSPFTNKVAAANPYEERFIFERQTADTFKMTYEVSRDGQQWRLGDYLVFKRKNSP